MPGCQKIKPIALALRVKARDFLPVGGGNEAAADIARLAPALQRGNLQGRAVIAAAPGEKTRSHG
jgi:hypothetical protein